MKADDLIESLSSLNHLRKKLQFWPKLDVQTSGIKIEPAGADQSSSRQDLSLNAFVVFRFRLLLDTQ